MTAPRKPDLTPYLGQRVRVIVDRPLGSVHPRHPDLTYPVNYGELPGTTSGDGHPIDAYLVGWDVPLREAEGTVAAIVIRPGDHEDKLIVVPTGAACTAEQLRAAVHFQERHFAGSRLIPGTLGA
ncbi:inorganic diphosphatase [Deinococcus maricopensis]|uniref:inorganic diphosphatase n=1 Tax=Deinococcus maricopensis (strain DSM 21211 / LMG 22137 / NRRL B-23946 / LB-34) TaxID=709986 RepID=E8U976_DEIML|nr:inorganic diphosphatase [Deinococcus maricopensis]ADV67615.1 inorganic pyrophosphatase-related protein [Deinococcus maricopensis DSM 21211]